MKVEHAKPKVGSTVTMDRGDFLSGKYAEELRALMVERSALVFRGMHLNDEEQLQFASTMGDVFLVGDEPLQNISMDPAINPVADYVRGAFYWHIDGANRDGDPCHERRDHERQQSGYENRERDPDQK